MFRKFNVAFVATAAVAVTLMLCLDAAQHVERRDDTVEALGVGDRGGEVYLIQKRLSELGYLTTEPSGVFELSTAEAVRRFQLDEGLYADGRLGEVELDALGLYSYGEMTPRVLRLGSTGGEVLRLQRSLRRLGCYDGELTGHFGGRTARAVREYRRRCGLRICSEVDAELMSRLGMLSGEGTLERFDGGREYRLSLLARLLETLVPDGSHREMVELALDALRREEESGLRLHTVVSLLVSSNGQSLSCTYGDKAERAALRAAVIASLK